MIEEEEISVRMASPDDIDAIAWLYSESFGSTRPRDDVEQYLKPDGTWALLATMGGTEAMTPAGFVLARTILDETEVFSVGVVPLYQRRGVGETLMKGTQHIAAIGGARTIFLEVGTDNPAAQSLYEKSGYTIVGRRPDYYLRDDGKRVAALLLRLTLDAQNGNNS